jgi:serine/threonine-protein kinase Chk1
LNNCHASGIAHRDVKPDSIIWTRDSRGLQITLTDFGFALNWHESDEVQKSNDEHIGTVPYMAPEILSKEPHNHYPADIWSAGVVVTELVV